MSYLRLLLEQRDDARLQHVVRVRHTLMLA